MAYHKITPNIVNRTIVKHLTPREEFPTACVYKDDDYFVRMHKALIKVNGKNCGIQYQFVLIAKRTQRKLILGTLYLLNTRYKSHQGMDFAWKNGDSDLSLADNLVDADTYRKAVFSARYDGKPFKMPRPNTSWGDMPIIGPNIARDLAKYQGEYDEVNVNHERLDYDWYFESSEEKDE